MLNCKRLEKRLEELEGLGTDVLEFCFYLILNKIKGIYNAESLKFIFFLKLL